jgi:hypothetical protein
VKKSFNIQELLHRKSKHHVTKPMHPSPSRAIQRDQECNMKASWFAGSHKHKTSKQKTLLHR